MMNLHSFSEESLPPDVRQDIPMMATSSSLSSEESTEEMVGAGQYVGGEEEEGEWFSVEEPDVSAMM
jgi:hypothetical protein